MHGRCRKFPHGSLNCNLGAAVVVEACRVLFWCFACVLCRVRLGSSQIYTAFCAIPMANKRKEVLPTRLPNPLLPVQGLNIVIFSAERHRSLECVEVRKDGYNPQGSYLAPKTTTCVKNIWNKLFVPIGWFAQYETSDAMPLQAMHYT